MGTRVIREMVANLECFLVRTSALAVLRGAGHECRRRKAGTARHDNLDERRSSKACGARGCASAVHEQLVRPATGGLGKKLQRSGPVDHALRECVAREWES